MTKGCAELVRYGGMGEPLVQPRPCKREAADGGSYCRLHGMKRATRGRVDARAGGWCVWCGRPGDRYESAGAPLAPIALCLRCAGALSVAIASRRRSVG